MIICGLFIALVLSVILAAMIGTMGPIGPGVELPDGKINKISIEAFFDIITGNGGKWADKRYDKIILFVRLPRVLLAAIVGSALAIVGAVMQAFFRNPMADPYILGVSSGAGVGAGICIIFGFSMSLRYFSVPFMAFLGAVITVFLVYNLARVGGRVRTDTLLLAGIATASFLSAIVAMLLYFGGERAHGLLFWLLGGFWKSDWVAISMSLPPVLLGTITLCFFSRELNVMTLGDEPALQLGVDIDALRWLLLIFCALLAGVAVAFSGIIGFVGLITPHMTRIIVGPNHKILLPASALAGSIFLVWADVVARTILSPVELPVGIITALCGAPFFIYLLRRSRRIRTR
jgi:iron complex transport system permease protein